MHAHIFCKAILLRCLKGSCDRAAAGSDTLCCLFGFPRRPCCCGAAPRAQHPQPGFGDNGRETLGEAAGSAPDHQKWVGGLGDTLAERRAKAGGWGGGIPMSPSTVLPLVK